MRSLIFLAAAPLLLAAAPAAATFTVNATVTGLTNGQGGRYIYTPISPDLAGPIGTSRANLQLNSGTYPYPFLGGATLGTFVAFCIEPLEAMGINVATEFKVVPLSQAASGLGGIGPTKANLIRELFGRFAPSGGHAAMTGPVSAAYQLAIWEIIMEAPGNALNISNATAAGGDWTMRRGDNVNNYTAFDQAQIWLSQIDGTGPRARGLVVLQNGILGEAGGSQDLLAFANEAGVPEPASWAMLIAGFGLTGAAMRRRRAVTA